MLSSMRGNTRGKYELLQKSEALYSAETFLATVIGRHSTPRWKHNVWSIGKQTEKEIASYLAVSVLTAHARCSKHMRTGRKHCMTC